MRIRDWSSDVCSSDLWEDRHDRAAVSDSRRARPRPDRYAGLPVGPAVGPVRGSRRRRAPRAVRRRRCRGARPVIRTTDPTTEQTMKSIEDLVSFWLFAALVTVFGLVGLVLAAGAKDDGIAARSEEQTSDIQSLMRISYAVYR